MHHTQAQPNLGKAVMYVNGDERFRGRIVGQTDHYILVLFIPGEPAQMCLPEHLTLVE